uniref:SFRICE_006688 n=1 Tax=Spodoptera frugiperda TaxID=7108 RepID=A0A2H1W9L2_SPOFR
MLLYSEKMKTITKMCLAVVYRIIDSLSAMTSSGCGAGLWPHALTAQAASSADRNPRAQPEPVGQKGSSKLSPTS